MDTQKILSSTTIVLVIIGLVVGAGLGWYLKPAPPEPEPEPEPKLLGVYDGETIVITASGGAIQEAFEEDINPGFIKYMKDTYDLNVNVEIYPFASTAEVIAKLDAAKKAGELPPFDVLEGPMGHLRIMHNLGLLEDLNYRNIPNAKNLIPEGFPYLAPGYGPAILLQTFQMAYNTEKADEIGIEVDSWLDLGDPKFKGKVGFPAPSYGTFVQVLWNLERALGGDEFDPELPLAFKWIEEVLLPNEPIFWTGSAMMQTLLETEEIWITPGFCGRTFALMARGVPLDFIGTKEGSYHAICTTEATKGTPHIRLAEEFINYMLTEEAQIWYAEHTYYGFSVPVDVPDHLEGYVMTAEKIQETTVLYDDVYYAEYKDQWVDRLEQLIASAR